MLWCPWYLTLLEEIYSVFVYYYYYFNYYVHSTQSFLFSSPLFSLLLFSLFFFLRYVQTIRSEVDEFLFSISSCGKSTVALRASFSSVQLKIHWLGLVTMWHDDSSTAHALITGKIKWSEVSDVLSQLSSAKGTWLTDSARLKALCKGFFFFFFWRWLWASCFSKDCHQLLKSSRLQTEWSFFWKHFSASRRGRKADIDNTTSTTHFFLSLFAGTKIVF